MGASEGKGGLGGWRRQVVKDCEEFGELGSGKPTTGFPQGLTWLNVQVRITLPIVQRIEGREECGRHVE